MTPMLLWPAAGSCVLLAGPAGPRRRPDLGAAAAPDRRALLEPVARPRRRAAARRGSGATCRSRCSSLGARQPGRRDGPAGGDRQPCRPARRRSSSRWTCRAACARPTSRPTGCIAAEEAARVVHRAPGLDAPRSGSSRSPASPRSSRRRRPTRRCCSTSSRRLATGRRTAIGSAILESIDAIAEIDPIVAPSQADGRPARRARRRRVPEGRLRAGDHRAADRRGEQRRARSRSRRPQQAADRGLRVYTIGFGTADPGGRPPRCGAQFIGSEPGDSGRRSAAVRVRRRRVRRRRRRLPARRSTRRR